MDIQERRLTVRLRKYWDMLCRGNPMPDIAHFNPATIEDLWPFCCRVRVDTHGETHFKYEYMGKSIAEMNGRDLTGTALDHRAKQFLGGTIFEKLGEVVATRQPQEKDGHLLNQAGSMIKYRACFLPFGSESKDLTHIIVGLSFRVF